MLLYAQCRDEGTGNRDASHTGHTHVLHYGEHGDPCKMAYSRFALTRRRCMPCEHKQIKARAHMLSDCVSDIIS